MDANEPRAVLQQGYQWYVIPHGLNPDDPTKLQVSVRIVPQFDLGADETVHSFARRAAGQLLRDWPAFLERGITLRIAACAAGDAAPDKPGTTCPLDLTVAWRQCIAQWDIRPRQVSRLWKAIIRPELRITSRTLIQAKVFPELSQSTGAEILRSTLGGIYSQGLSDARRPADQPGDLPGQIVLALRAGQEDLMKPLTRILGTLDTGRTRGGILNDWYIDRLRVAGLNLNPNLDAKELENLRGNLANVTQQNDMQFMSPIYKTVADYVVHRYITMIPELRRPQRPTPQEAELHSELSKLTLHPWLLQTLGLSIPGEINAGLLDQNANSLYVASVDSAFGTDMVPVQGVKVVCSLDSRNPFYPAEKTTDQATPLRYSRGCVNLSVKDRDEAIFTLEQLDTDSLAEKLVQAAQNLNCQLDAGVRASQREITMPPLPTTGISLLMKGTARQMIIQQQQRSSFLTGAWQTFYAENLIIGYRPDIAPLAPDSKGSACLGPWKSLVGRKLESLRADGRGWTNQFARPPRDEGIVTQAPRKLMTPDQQEPDRQEATRIPSQEIFRWQGWSLAANTIECRPDSASRNSTRIAVDYSSDGGLPKQRVGWGYRVGLRAVFMDGRSLSLDEARKIYQQYPELTIGTSKVGEVSDEYFLPFFRYEPILAPTPLLRGKLDRHSLPTQRVDFLAIASQRPGKSGVAATERALVPPRVDLQATIRLGMFDQDHHRVPKGAFSGVRLNPDGSFPNSGNKCLSDLFGEEPIGDTCYIEDTTTSPAEVPYLPDPWAQRLVIGIYRSDGKLLALEYHDYYSQNRRWPDCNPLMLRLEAASLETLHSEGYDLEWRGSTLVVKVASGIALRVCCWHEVTERMLANSGIVEMMAHYLCGDEACAKALCRAPAADGTSVPVGDIRDQLIQCLSQWHRRRAFKLHPFLASGRPAKDINLTSFSMLNPACRLELAHLVTLPVRAPQFCEASLLDKPRAALLPTWHSRFAQRFEVHREKIGQTVATLYGDIEFHRSSTVRLECLGQWQEFDDQAASTPQQSTQNHSLFTFEAISPALNGPGRSGAAEPAADQDLLLLNGVRSALGRDSNRDLQERFPDTPKEQCLIQHDFVDAKARLVTFSLRATSRFLKHFPEAQQNVLSEPGPQTSRWVMATKPPAPPSVAYVVPLLQSSKRSQPGLQVHKRHGNWIRIWLERPWYSSGEGELLALVCWPGDLLRPRGGARDYLLDQASRAWGSVSSPPVAGKAPDIPEQLKALFTGWGHDPIWEQKGKLRLMPAGAFANRLDTGLVRVVPSQLLAGHSPTKDDERVGLALYEPQYHKAEQRWYADVQITPDGDAYYPFVRLCLARYQPNAIAGCELSEIVSSEFIQLLPEREVSIQVSEVARKVARLQVSIAGPVSLRLSEVATAATSAKPGPANRMVLRVDRAHGNPREGTAWLPVLDKGGREVTELAYADGLWTLPRSQQPLYELEDDVLYSVYLEERQVVMVDGEEPTDNTYPRQPSVCCSERLVYVNRLMMPSRE